MSLRTRSSMCLPLIGLCLVMMGQQGPCGSSEVRTDDVTRDTTEQAPTTLGGTVDVASLNVPAGATTTVVSDTVINATGDVRIDGQLVASASPGAGFSIRIVAGGNIDVSGTVQAGDGAAAAAPVAKSSVMLADGAAAGTGQNGHAGGTVELKAGGNLTVTELGSLHAGNGSDGTDGTRGGAGGKGGSVAVCAGGQLIMRGFLHVGDGGRGGDASTDTASSTPSPRFENAGGDSGFLYVSAAAYDWPGLDATNMVLNPAEYGFVSGGAGGEAGSVSIMDDLTLCVLAGLSPADADAGADNTGADTDSGGSGDITGTVTRYRQRWAAKGGQGWWVGGIGGGVSLVACTHEGYNGTNWVVWGGDGGSVTRRQDPSVTCGGSPVVIAGAVAAAGGLASGIASPGLMGDQSHPDGGHGGSMQATGGNGGRGEFLAGHTGGSGGQAFASAGFGGDGHSRDCEDPGAGGNGGNGGDATAVGGDGGDGAVPGKGGVGQALTPPAGTGGNGGEGVPGGGLGGQGGALVSVTGADGVAGAGAIVGTIERQSQAADGQPGESFDPAWCQD